MAKKKHIRNWFWYNYEETLVGASPSGFNSGSTRLLSVADGNLNTGDLRLNRLFGSVSLYVQGPTGGDSSLSFWHGLWHGDDEDAANASIGHSELAPMDAEENEGDWLWREPIYNMIPVDLAGDTKDYRFYQGFDWSVRGGRGQMINSAQSFLYVVTITGSALATITVRWSMRALALYDFVS